VLGTYEAAPGDSTDALRLAHQVPANDPLLLVPALAQVTSHLGFAVTVSASYEPPFAHARRMSTVDHLAKGRVGWNVVTSYLDNAARNFGLDGQIAHDERYERAEEYLQVCYQLWEGSWEDGAVLRDRERGIFTDPAKVHYIVKLPADDSGRGPGRFLGQFIEERGGQPTVADLLAVLRRNGGVDPFAVVGTPQEIADKIEEYVARTDLDGFNVHSNVSPESYQDFVELVVPVLQARGLFRARYDPAETTLRERLFGVGRTLLPATHPAAAYRRTPAASQASVPASR
jgi:alkanesulfonate monooxygenase SsuD/methylene tetrahydromethanopterin reductase-like flavin-dependent oxidoreductase (luciferase family)